MPLPILSNIKTAKYFNYDPRFNGVFSRDNLPRMKDGAYIINLNDKQSEVRHWVSFFILHSFGIDYIPQKVLRKIKDKSITHNIFRAQSDESIMSEFYCIIFIEYMLAGKTLLDYTNLFSSTNYRNNDKTYI